VVAGSASTRGPLELVESRGKVADLFKRKKRMKDMMEHER